jgi:hypothetical protein
VEAAITCVRTTSFVLLLLVTFYAVKRLFCLMHLALSVNDTYLSCSLLARFKENDDLDNYFRQYSSLLKWDLVSFFHLK